MLRFVPLFFLLFNVVFCVAQNDTWRSPVIADQLWKYAYENAAISEDWRTINYDDSSWLEGQGGFGYADNDDNTIIPPAASVFMRASFEVSDLSAISNAILHADFDDGFVAYLNGQEIARSNIAGNFPSHDASAIDYREAQIYQGGLPLTFPLSNTALQAILLEGTNVLAVQTHNFGGTNSSDMSALYWFSLLSADDSLWNDPPAWLVTENISSNLPIVKINTNNISVPDDPAIPATLSIIWNEDGSPNFSDAFPNEYQGPIDIETRGNSSQFFFPKKNFGIEIKDENGEDMDTSFLDFPSEEDFILHGPYSDKSLMRNDLVMHLTRSIGQYASKTRFVELFLNEQYEGIYLLMERIKRDENRVDIAKLGIDENEGDDLTGGYIIRLDHGEVDWFSSFDIFSVPGQKIAFQYVSPSRTKITPQQANYIQSYVDSFEISLNNPSEPYGGKYYYEYMDLASFAEHFIISELGKNVDAYRLSSYLHKDKDSNGGLLKAGPIWDFNLAFGNADYCGGGFTNGWIYDVHCGYNPFWYDRLLKEERFTQLLACKWAEYREGPFHRDSIFAYIDQRAELLDEAQERNFERFDILETYIWPNFTVEGSYIEEKAFLKTFIANRLTWMDNNMPGNCLSSQTGVIPSEIKLYPNPASDQITIAYHEDLNIKRINITNLLGNTIKNYSPIIGQKSIQIDVADFAQGSYIIQLSDETGTILGSSKFIKIQD